MEKALKRASARSEVQNLLRVVLAARQRVCPDVSVFDQTDRTPVGIVNSYVRHEAHARQFTRPNWERLSRIPARCVAAVASAFCADASPTNQRHPDCSVPVCICLCHSRRSQATWKVESRGVMPSKNVEDFSPQVESVGLMEKLERLGGNRDSTRVSSR
jgi:hypothetical protein